MRILAGMEGGWRTITVLDADRGQRARAWWNLGQEKQG